MKRGVSVTCFDSVHANDIKFRYTCSLFLFFYEICPVKYYPHLLLGKVWKPKEQEKIQINEDEAVDTEWDEVLANATEEELVDLAGTATGWKFIWTKF